MIRIPPRHTTFQTMPEPVYLMIFLVMHALTLSFALVSVSVIRKFSGAGFTIAYIVILAVALGFFVRKTFRTFIEPWVLLRRTPDIVARVETAQKDFAEALRAISLKDGFFPPDREGIFRAGLEATPRGLVANSQSHLYDPAVKQDYPVPECSLPRINTAIRKIFADALGPWRRNILLRELPDLLEVHVRKASMHEYVTLAPSGKTVITDRNPA